MIYDELAQSFMEIMYTLRSTEPPKVINESMRGEQFALQYIYQQKKQVLPSEICQYMHISSARVAATLNSLEKKGLITRQIDKNDRRRILVKLTPQGKEAAQSHQQQVLEKTSKMLKTLGEHDAQEFIRILEILARTMAKHKHCHPESTE